LGLRSSEEMDEWLFQYAFGSRHRASLTLDVHMIVDFNISDPDKVFFYFMHRMSSQEKVINVSH
jgi:hypothetical protein